MCPVRPLAAIVSCGSNAAVRFDTAVGFCPQCNPLTAHLTQRIERAPKARLE